MRYVVLGCFLAAIVPALPVQAQTAQAPAAAQTSATNDDFRRLAVMAESFDYESSRLALTQSRRPSIKRYAASLMGNFRFDGARLASGASVFSGIPALPADPNATPAPFS